MIRPSPTPEQIASESLRMAYEGEATKPSDIAPTMGLSPSRMAKKLHAAGLPSATRLISLGRVMRGIGPYLTGEATLTDAAIEAGWHSYYSLNASCRSATGRSPSYWKAQGADLYDVVQGAMTQHPGTFDPEWLREPEEEEDIPEEERVHQIWIAEEKRLHEKRKAERKAGLRRDLSPTRTYGRDLYGRKVYARKPGVRAF